MIRFLRGVWQPEIYHGFGRRPPYFEGWYFRLTDASQSQRWAVIPGIFMAEDAAKSHAFIQVLDGMTGQATYHEFPIEAFEAHARRFDVRIGENHFTTDGFSLAIDDPVRPIYGQVGFHERVPLPVSLYNAGIMGPFAYIPFMECYHGIVGMQYELSGGLNLAGREVSFTGGRGYVEKDWGTNFPSAYVWMQTNHFQTPETSLSASVARIPLSVLNFTGLIVALWHQGMHYRWATYTGARLEKLHIDEAEVAWTLAGWNTRLTMVAQRQAGGLLKAPLRTEMHKRVDETMQSAVHVRLETRDGRVLLDDTGTCAGLEVYGDIERLVKK